MNGLSQDDRKKRINETQAFAVIDGRMEALLQQAEVFAKAIRYYNLNSDKNIDWDGYFDQFLQDLIEIRKSGIKHFNPDGNLEPAQALLFVFLKQLQEIIEKFNQRWQEYPDWYLNDILGIKPLRIESHKICLSFTKNTEAPLYMEKGLGFRLKGDAPDAPVYRLTEDTSIGNTSIENIISVYFRKCEDVYLASKLGFVTSLNIKKLPDNPSDEDVLFGNDRDNLNNSKTFGFIITSPSLLLKEGKRMASITLEPENKDKIQETLDWIVNTLSQQNSQSKDSIRHLMLHNIFYLHISTLEGWEMIENYSVKIENSCIILCFTLDEKFPETTSCTLDIHKFLSEFPALKVYLNLDAWLYPFSWFNKYLLKKIRIRTEVEGLSNILVYNDLGKVDCSKPFQPFGINTEKGTWMVIGNYETAIKNTKSIDLKIRWGQLPANENGFRGYYAGYGQNIDNTSFKVRAKYLSGYTWREDKDYQLFGTLPDAPLKDETILYEIDISKMPTVNLKEEQYEYSINAKTGFVVFQLCSPDTGFGEKQYRAIFPNYIMKKIKKKKISAPNTPFSPVIEKLTMNYISEETVDLQNTVSTGLLEYYHVTPLSIRNLYPHSNKRFIKPVFEMDTYSSLLILLKDLYLGGMLNLYIDFFPHKVKVNTGQIPQIKLFLGNGYNWEPVPNGFIIEDKTMNLMRSGFIKINIPGNISNSLFDSSGRIWLRVGIEKNAEVIPSINKIHIHVAEAEFNPDTSENDYYNRLLNGMEWSPERVIPGLDGVSTVASYAGREKETPTERLMRISEYVSHRGKAVTPRDYERITLQAFPDIVKVKCLPTFNVKNDAKNRVTLVIIPRKTKKEGEEYWKPMATSRQILNVEQFFKDSVSAYVHDVDVVNPLYEEVTVYCHITFNNRYPVALCHTRITDLLNGMIAPWQKCYEPPLFDYSLDMAEIRQAVSEQDFVEGISQFSIIVISKKNNDLYNLNEYDKDDNIISPSTPYSVFVPSKEHIFVSSDIENTFGIDDMTIDNSFIISN
ncbi:MAG: hypothetical protein LBG15_14865 [Dysgonamonadaceae bacterium]|jgi:hypothetical protein|nr:hypothetical protein [Dysgonamonadaceae bacterium]